MHQLFKTLIHHYLSLKLRVNQVLKSITIPGTSGMTMYHFASYFRPVITGNLNARASAISFKLFLAIFPGIIFIFTIIPYIPIRDVQPTLMLIIRDILPDDVFPMVQKTISDIINIRHTGLLSVGFILTLYFSSGGFISLISSFNQSINITETRTWIQKRAISLILTVVTTLIIIVAVALMAIGHTTIEWLVRKGFLTGQTIYTMLPAGRWFILALMIYLSVALIYYIAPAKKAGFGFFSVGSFISALLLIALTWGFGLFIRYFSAYNALYGSAGTLLTVMLFIYYNSTILLIGFELNASIQAMKKKMARSQQEAISHIV
jgi:membrane protein